MSLEYEFDVPVYSKRNYIPFIADTLTVRFKATLLEWSNWFPTARFNACTVTWT